MDEVEWRASEDPMRLLNFLYDRAGDREVRLALCGFARSVWGVLWSGDLSRDAVEVAERYADGLVSPDELAAAADRAEHALELYPDEPVYDVAFWACLPAAQDRTDEASFYAANVLVMAHPGPGSDAQNNTRRAAERRTQADIVRDVFGPLPFRPVTLAPAWRTPTAVAVARAIYDGRTFHDLPVLADALQDAGCDHGELLAHCCGGGVHVRGCWAVDLVLGKR